MTIKGVDSMKGKREDYIHGGMGDKACYCKMDQRQLDMGQKVEMEHTTDPKKAREIAGDHLVETPDYYDRLHELEEDFEKDHRKAGVTYIHPHQRKGGTCVKGHFRKLPNR